MRRIVCSLYRNFHFIYAGFGGDMDSTDDPPGRLYKFARV